MTIKEKERFEELAEKAREIFLSNSDYNPEDWLDDEKEREEYIVLLQKFLDVYEKGA